MPQPDKQVPTISFRKDEIVEFILETARAIVHDAANAHPHVTRHVGQFKILLEIHDLIEETVNGYESSYSAG